MLGFTMEAVNFVTALDKKARVKVKVTNPSDCRNELRKIDLTFDAQQTVLRLIVRLFLHPAPTVKS